MAQLEGSASGDEQCGRVVRDRAVQEPDAALQNGQLSDVAAAPAALEALIDEEDYAGKQQPQQHGIGLIQLLRCDN